MKFIHSMTVLILAVAMSGCSSLRAYDGPAQSDAAVAHISGDYRVTAGAPVSVLLRSVDGRVLRFWHHAADVEDGEHRLLIDCKVADGEQLSRYEITVTVEAGERYRLAADATTRAGCSAVRLETLK